MATFRRVNSKDFRNLTREYERVMKHARKAHDQARIAQLCEEHLSTTAPNEGVAGGEDVVGVALQRATQAAKLSTRHAMKAFKLASRMPELRPDPRSSERALPSRALQAARDAVIASVDAQQAAAIVWHLFMELPEEVP